MDVLAEVRHGVVLDVLGVPSGVGHGEHAPTVRAPAHAHLGHMADIIIEVYMVKGTSLRSGRVTHFERKCSKPCFFLLSILWYLKMTLSVCNSFKTCIISVDLGKSVSNAFPCSFCILLYFYIQECAISLKKCNDVFLLSNCRSYYSANYETTTIICFILHS